MSGWCEVREGGAVRSCGEAPAGELSFGRVVPDVPVRVLVVDEIRATAQMNAEREPIRVAVSMLYVQRYVISFCNAKFA